MTSETRRQKALVVTPDLMLNIATTGHTINARCTEGVPEGSRFNYVYYDEVRRHFLIVCEHESFPQLGKDESLPEIVAHFVEANNDK